VIGRNGKWIQEDLKMGLSLKQRGEVLVFGDLHKIIYLKGICEEVKEDYTQVRDIKEESRNRSPRHKNCKTLINLSHTSPSPSLLRWRTWLKH